MDSSDMTRPCTVSRRCSTSAPECSALYRPSQAPHCVAKSQAAERRSPAPFSTVSERRKRGPCRIQTASAANLSYSQRLTILRGKTADNDCDTDSISGASDLESRLRSSRKCVAAERTSYSTSITATSYAPNSLSNTSWTLSESQAQGLRAMLPSRARRNRQDRCSNGRSKQRSLSHLVAALVLISILSFCNSSDACSARSTPKPSRNMGPGLGLHRGMGMRRPSSSLYKPNVTFQTYACPPAYAAWYCLNGAACFTVKISDSILYNCECVHGYTGQRCEFKDFDGAYDLDKFSHERLVELKDSAVGRALFATIFVICSLLVVGLAYSRRRSDAKMGAIADKMYSSFIVDFKVEQQLSESGDGCCDLNEARIDEGSADYSDSRVCRVSERPGETAVVVEVDQSKRVECEEKQNENKISISKQIATGFKGKLVRLSNKIVGASSSSSNLKIRDDLNDSGFGFDTPPMTPNDDIPGPNSVQSQACVQSTTAQSLTSVYSISLQMKLPPKSLCAANNSSTSDDMRMCHKGCMPVPPSPSFSPTWSSTPNTVTPLAFRYPQHLSCSSGDWTQDATSRYLWHDKI